MSMKKNQVADAAAISLTNKSQNIDSSSRKSPSTSARSGAIVGVNRSKSGEQENFVTDTPFESQKRVKKTNSSDNFKMNKKLKGILSHSEERQTTQNNKLPQSSKCIERKDQFGTNIKGGTKLHRIQFADEIEEVHEVENWKEYNVIEKNGICSCQCVAFQTNLLAILVQ